jgi:surface antigen
LLFFLLITALGNSGALLKSITMKRLLPIFSFALILSACNTSVPAEATKAVQTEQATPSLDTVGLSAFQNWKAQNELAQAEALNQPQQNTAETPRPVRKQSAPAPKRVVTAPKSKPISKPAPQPEAKDEVAKGEGSMNNESAGEAKAEEKKGWSKATKGAVIGGAAGAAAGAILVKKNKAAGAVIGGVVGAIGGHVIGGKMDKKDQQKSTPNEN